MSKKLINYKEKNGMWKGNNVGLIGLHKWIKSHKQKSNLCEKCKKNKSYDLANISGKYKREINDFEWLCRKCHMIKDGRLNKLKEFSEKKKLPKKLCIDCKKYITFKSKRCRSCDNKYRWKYWGGVKNA